MLLVSWLALFLISFQPQSPRQGYLAPPEQARPPLFPGRIDSTDLAATEVEWIAPADVAAADMDHDGQIDVLISRSAPRTALSLLRGDGLDALS